MPYRASVVLLLVLLLAGCSGDAVVFAPTPPPPDLSPLPYAHPSGAFTVIAPRNWAIYETNTPSLAATAFSRPGETDPALTVAVVNLGAALGDDAFGALLDRWQTQLRPDVTRYVEVSRQAMGDGSWRMTGARTRTSGEAQGLNTFIQRTGDRLALIEIVLPDDTGAQTQMGQIVNSVVVNPGAALEASGVEMLTNARPASIGVIHTYAWTTAEGVFFITGEVANFGGATLVDLPVRAVLLGTDGTVLAGAEDVAMGYGILPGGFAPFSLRFGQGQPPGSMGFDVQVGGGDGTVQARTLVSEAQFRTQDVSSFDALGRFVVSGEIEHIGDAVAANPRAVVTVFDAAQNVIAAGFADVGVEQLAPGERARYEVAIPELGGEPATFSVMVQGIGE
jgi:hypothetical protein